MIRAQVRLCIVACAPVNPSLLVPALCQPSYTLAGSSCNASAEREDRSGAYSSSAKCCSHHRLRPRAGNDMPRYLSRWTFHWWTLLLPCIHAHFAHSPADRRIMCNKFESCLSRGDHTGIAPASQLGCLYEYFQWSGTVNANVAKFTAIVVSVPCFVA